MPPPRKLAMVMIGGAALGLAACAEGEGARLASPGRADAGRPPQSACPAVANLDLAALARQAAADPRAAATRAWIAGQLAPVVVPETAERRPPADAPFVIRVRVPSGGFWSADDRSVVWREDDGSWWFWRRTIDSRQPPPPPPPGEAAVQPTEEQLYPARSGRLAPGKAARMEAAFADPCRAWEPDGMPNEVPLRRAENAGGPPIRLCPPDSASYLAEIAERGRPPRQVYAACINDTATFTLIDVATYASGEDPR
ncbi:MAG: hypothetical protein QOH47_1895 [Sphingomonadales bacterium]|jgi:hypothetical protein|nr:hypothetical protein [Sphingomonadales bacterium]